MRKQNEQNIRKLTRIGQGSLGLTLPKEMVGELKWKDKQKVKVAKKGSKLIVSDWKPKRK